MLFPELWFFTASQNIPKILNRDHTGYSLAATGKLALKPKGVPGLEMATATFVKTLLGSKLLPLRKP